MIEFNYELIILKFNSVLLLSSLFSSQVQLALPPWKFYSFQSSIFWVKLAMAERNTWTKLIWTSSTWLKVACAKGPSKVLRFHLKEVNPYKFLVQCIFFLHKKVITHSLSIFFFFWWIYNSSLHLYFGLINFCLSSSPHKKYDYSLSLYVCVCVFSGYLIQSCISTLSKWIFVLNYILSWSNLVVFICCYFCFFFLFWFFVFVFLFLTIICTPIWL